MPVETLRVSPATLSEVTGEPMTVILKRAVDAYSRKAFLDQCDRAYARLRQDPKAWAAELAERQAWDAALGDGLEDA